MPKLHLVGITPDHTGLVLSEYARAKRGDLTLDIDDGLLAAIEEARRLRARDQGKNLRSAALPTRREESPADGKAGSSLSPKEIQARLRMGHTVTAIAREAGVGEAWIERFAPPVLAEQVRIVDKAKQLTLVKRGVGASAEPLGRAVPANVVERGASPSLADLDSAWRAYQRDDGTWCITFSFVQRGRRQTAEWVMDSGEVTARNRLAAELGHRDKRASLAPAPAPAKVEKRPLRAKTTKPKTAPKAVTPKPATKTTAPKPAPKTAAPKPAPKAVEPKPVEPKAEAPKPAPKGEEPKPAPEAEAPKPAPRAEEPKPVAALVTPAPPLTATVASPPPAAPVEANEASLPSPPPPPPKPATPPAPRARKAPVQKAPARKAPVPAEPPEVSSPAEPEVKPDVVAEAQSELDLTEESTELGTETERAPKGRDRASAEQTRTP